MIVYKLESAANINLLYFLKAICPARQFSIIMMCMYGFKHRSRWQLPENFQIF